LAKDNATALEVARQGIVLLKNDGALPLASDVRSLPIRLTQTPTRTSFLRSRA
jgi:hypothetical protein